MKLGLIYPQNEIHGDPQAVRRIGTAAEAEGYAFLVAYDHVLGATHDREPKLNGPYTERDPFHDPLAMFAYLAAITTRIELVTGVLILPQRQTALVARQAADVDLLSGGRLRLGVGLGWNYVEYDALGQDFATRGKRLEEQVPLLRRLWSEPLVTFDGRFDHIDRAALVPRPERRIPVWLGGFADVALARGARIGDGFIFADGAADAFAQVAALRGHLAAAGRGEEPFGLQINMLAAKTPESVVETAMRWRDAGGTHAAVNTMGQGLGGQGLGDAAAHVDYARRVADALRGAGLLG
ncbi:MAG: LLM class F420-dependent oxidoreductase [Sphingomonadales bacterium]|nr:LLM class F420-dependent oxidoreductase [Sphingomonadales bacterium]